MPAAGKNAGDIEIVSRKMLTFPVLTKKTNIDSVALVLKETIKLGFCRVFPYLVNISAALKLNTPLIERLDRLIFVGAVNCGIGLQADDQVIAIIARFLECKHMPCMEKIVAAAGKPSFHLGVASART